MLTDGVDNQHQGPLAVGTEPNGDIQYVDADFTCQINSGVLADHLQHIGVKVCVLGIGTAAQPMVANMLNRKNVFVGHIEHGADVKAVASIVQTLKRVSKGSVPSVTRNGMQHALLITLNEEVQESIRNLTPNEVREINDVMGDVIVSTSSIVCPKDIARQIDAVFDQYDNDISGHEKDIKAGLLLAMESMCDGPIPAAIVSSKHSSIIGVPQGWRDYRRSINRIFSQLANENVVKREQAVPEGGVIVKNNGEDYRFSAGCAQYSCVIPKAAIVELANDAEYCTPRDQLPEPKKKKRKRSDSTDSNKNKK